ncbi:hypothetical protein QPK87_05595 [Kamptonema cortianum]|nr:hypothetical protein [Geitlerinema splendidum]MDK3156051.1 hypothetical protein [Kamptonema cortianum]
MYTRLVDGRDHPEGIPRDQLIWSLNQERIVRTAIRIDRCLLCREPGVNESGLCLLCFSYLTPDERPHAEMWTMGAMP